MVLAAVMIAFALGFGTGALVVWKVFIAGETFDKITRPEQGQDAVILQFPSTKFEGR